MKQLDLSYRWIKNDQNCLDESFIEYLKNNFGLERFIETGTYLGDTSQQMARLFDLVETVEIEKSLFEKADSRFKTRDEIKCHFGNSADFLKKVVRPGARGLIWLDAHHSGEGTGRWGDSNTPIEAELDCITQADPNGEYLILIDDLRYFIASEEVKSRHESISGYPEAGHFCKQLSGIYDITVLGDVLMLVPKKMLKSVSLMKSPFLEAYTAFRCSGSLLEVSAVVSAAEREKIEIENIPNYLLSQREYGLGAHYFFARALLRSSFSNDVLTPEDSVLMSDPANFF